MRQPVRAYDTGPQASGSELAWRLAVYERRDGPELAIHAMRIALVRASRTARPTASVALTSSEIRRVLLRTRWTAKSNLCGYREETMAIQQRWSIHPAPPQFVTLSREGEHTLTIVDGVACIDGRGAIGGVAAAQFAEDASRVRSERSR